MAWVVLGQCITLHAGASSAAVVKHLEVQGYALAELALRQSSHSSPSLRSNQETVSAGISGQVGGVTGIPGQAVEAPAHSEARGGVTGLSVRWPCVVLRLMSYFLPELVTE